LGRITAFYGVVAVVACFLPLMSVVSYESAALYGVLSGFVSLFWPIARQGAPVDRVMNRVSLHLGALLLPVALLSLNSLRVTNCSPGLGYLFWLLIPVISVVVGTSIRLVVDEYATVSLRRRNVIAGIVGLLSVFAFLWQLAMQPPINGFQLFLGYFSGSLYDEALSLPDGLVYYRIWCLALAGALVGCVEVKYRYQSWLPLRHAIVATTLLVILAVVGWTSRQHFGVDHDRTTIAQRLGGRLETEHFEIYFPATREWYKKAKLLGEDHEFRYAQMAEYFGTDPVAANHRKIRSFVYSDREQKGALMGGRRTLVAKLWLGEMHIQWREFGDHLLAHELAHIFTEPFGAGPLRLSSRYGIAVNMGLVEGIATAADWPASDLNVHMAAAALRRMDAAPDIRRMLGATGFWTQSSGRAYTLMGSFIAFLVKTRGIEKLKKAYPNGDFEHAYSQSIDSLVAEWEGFVDAIPLTEREMARAKFQYDRPSIFEKICARTVAELRRQAEEHGRLGERESGIAAWQTILGFDPENIRYRLEFAEFLISVDLLDQAETQLNQAMSRDTNAVEKAVALELLGDVMWRRGDAEHAQTNYRTCMESGVSSDRLRMLQVKSLALERAPAVARIAFEYLLDGDNDLGAYGPSKWVAAAADDPLGHYLLGRRLHSAERYDDAIIEIQASLTGLPEGVLADEARFLLTSAYYFVGNLDAAELALRPLTGAPEPYATLATEWSHRIAWARRNRLEGR